MGKEKMKIMNLPLELTGRVPTLSAMHVFHLIWLKVCFKHSFEDVIVTSADRKRIGLHVNSYARGLEDLVAVGIIRVIRKAGSSTRISINTELLEPEIRRFVMGQQ